MNDKSIINYRAFINEAMYTVVRKVLKQIEGDSLPGKHSFYITFLTNFKGVKLSEEVKKKHPEVLTIVLQYQFEDLVVEEDRFSVTLSFNNRQERICVPYKSILSFADPSVDIELTLVPTKEKPEEQPENTIKLDMKHSKNSIAIKETDNVINLDELRKKK